MHPGVRPTNERRASALRIEGGRVRVRATHCGLSPARADSRFGKKGRASQFGADAAVCKGLVL